MTLIGKLTDDVVLFEKQAIEDLYNKSFYGRPKEDKLEISFTESAYLISIGKINVEFNRKNLDFKNFFLEASSLVKNFELFYIVYKDLRERGYYIQPGVTGFRVYPRGGHPGKTPSEFFILVTSERIPLPLSQMRLHLETVENLKKRLIIAIVDEESDITYYEARKIILDSNYELNLRKNLSTACLLEDRAIVWNSDCSLYLHQNGFFGKRLDEGHLQLSLIESCYLLSKDIMKIEDRYHRNLDFAQFSEIASKIEPNFMIKYAVYETLRNKGLVPKTGFKFGTHFRVYKDIGDIIKQSHSDYLVHAVNHNHIFSLQQLSQAVRLANSVRKEMIYGEVNSHVEFFSIGRMRL